MLDYAPNARRRNLDVRRRWLIASGAALLYFLPWFFRFEIRLIGPMANMRYYYFVDDPDTCLDRGFYYLYWPMIRLSYLMDEWRYGERCCIHHADRRRGWGGGGP